MTSVITALALTVLAQDFRPDAEEQRQRAQMEMERARSEYQRALRSLDQGRWEAAVESLKKAGADTARADAALYWSAFALFRKGDAQAAMASLQSLRSAHPTSRWLNDAKALELEIQQAAGKPVPPEQESDEEVRMIAVNSVMQSDPERGIAYLEKVLNGSNTLRVKRQAMFMLGMNRSPKTRDLVVRYAKGGSNPDLQRQAIETLGAMGADSGPMIKEIYDGAQDAELKRVALSALSRDTHTKVLIEIARTEKNRELRRQAVEMLSHSRSKDAKEYMLELLK
ncbi:MAG: hypothetical protein FJW40_01700 [Acidobacteria bacterium]|nr:hypothetical protein [Acidobacteriota bacterium]